MGKMLGLEWRSPNAAIFKLTIFITFQAIRAFVQRGSDPETQHGGGHSRPLQVAGGKGRLHELHT